MDKSLQLQHQIRENSEELQDYLKDLVNWEKEMKTKEEEVKKRTHEDPVLPPIRTTHSSVKKKKTKDKKTDATKEKSTESAEQKDSQKAARIPGYDYRAWDLFNVDEALKEVDEHEKEENRKSTSEEEESDESENEMYQMEKKKQLAVVEKDKGNQFFKKGNYDMAISCYTDGMEYDPDNALLPANRAMAFIKKGQLAAAERDCTTCLSLDPSYVKAYLRRGTARIGLKKYGEAKLDFCTVLKLEPDNNQAKLELERLEKEILLSKNKIDVDCTENEKLVNKFTEVPDNCKGQDVILEAKNKIKISSGQSDDAHNYTKDEIISSHTKPGNILRRLLTPEDKDSCTIEPIQKPPHLRSQKPMKLITIKDVSGITELSSPAVEEKYSSDVTTSVQKEISSVDTDEDNQDVTISSVTKEESVQPDAGETISVSSMSPDHFNSSESNSKSTDITNSIPMTLPSLPNVPLTSYQFLSAWKKIRTYPELLYEYIKQFPPERLPIVFKQSIDTELFCGILQTLSIKFVENDEDVFLYLKHLRKVGRFKTLVLFLAEEEITALKKLFQFVKSSQKYSLEEIQNVEKDYDLS